MTSDYQFPHWYKPTKSSLPEYGQWAAMISRCRNPNATKFKDYGGRGIKVCDRWERGEYGLTGFDCFYMDMGPRPSKAHSVDRINNSGDYCPSNCKWSTNTEQARNRRSNHLVMYNGETMSMMAMAEKYGLSYYVFRNRAMRGWTIDRIIETPVRVHSKIDFDGEQISQRGLSKKLNLNNSTVRGRLRKGWSFKAAISIPLLPSGHVAKHMRSQIDQMIASYE